MTPKFHTLTVKDISRETEDTVTLYFEQPEPFLEYKPGQFLTLVIDFEGKEQRRSYSLCTSPFVDPFPGISVKRVPDGLFSNFLNEKVRRKAISQYLTQLIANAEISGFDFAVQPSPLMQ